MEEVGHSPEAKAGLQERCCTATPVGNRSSPAEAGLGRASSTALAILCVLAFLNYMDRMILAAVLPDIKAEFGLNDTSVGLLSAAFAVTYAVAGIPLARLADLRSRRNLISVATGVWSLATALCGLAGSYWALFWARCAVGVGEAGLFPASYSLLSDYFSAARRNMVLGILYFVIALGTATGLALGAWLATHLGWRGAFLVLGLPGLLFAVLAFFLIKEPARGRLDGGGDIGQDRSFTAALSRLLRLPVYVWLAFTFGLNAFSAAGMAQWLPSFFARTSGLSLGSIGLMFGLAYGFGFGLGQFTGGIVAARMAKKEIFAPLKLCIYASAAICPLVLAMLWSSNSMVAMVLAALSSAVAGFSVPAQSAGLQNAVPAGVRATAMGISTFLTAILGTSLGPVLVGIGSDLLAPSFGSREGLRIALSIAQIVPLVTTYTAWRAFHAAKQTYGRQP